MKWQLNLKSDSVRVQDIHFGCTFVHDKVPHMRCDDEGVRSRVIKEYGEVVIVSLLTGSLYVISAYTLVQPINEPMFTGTTKGAA